LSFLLIARARSLAVPFVLSSGLSLSIPKFSFSFLPAFLLEVV
jgi:hypothetical protein